MLPTDDSNVRSRQNVGLDFSDELIARTIRYYSGYWEGTDTPQLWEINSKRYEDTPTVLYYLENPISYDRNSHNFRTPDEFNTEEPGNIFLGCSHTFGTGHHLENVWSYKLSKDIGGKFFNLAQGGHGAFTCYRLFRHWVDKLNVENVFMFLQESPRWDLFNSQEGNWFTVGPWTDWAKSNLEAHSLMMDERSTFVMQEAVLGAIKYECEIRGIGFYHGSFDPVYINTDKKIKARDFMHYTVEQQDLLYKEFKRKFDEKIMWK